ncbi:GNAT family N-acetyltransferase [Clostridium folliculivorans]|uniref:Acetyltransferase n=1 Tax=Clostridium folliculivorans TaxID=2886038 RepID=A0A9W5Y0T9_9CLOT|nr:GNAT family N-acetyltransferase [Clostridium folliculivorans]GKU24669.1 acetyltransferase [Clostridium folliculivorans]GKU30767.1 acetyltransferase [Clostridium folliculivorans]
MIWKIKTFNQLTGEEVYKLLKLRSEVFVVEQNCVYLDPDGKDQHSYHLYLEDEGEIVACTRILNKGVAYEQASIGRVIVRKDYRGKSISREMLAKAISFIEENIKETEIKIQAQAYLFDFYGSFGFKAISEEYLEDGIPHIDMLYKK